MATFGDLVVRLNLDSRKFTSGVNKAQASLGKFSRLAKGAALGAVSALAAGIAAAATAAIVAAKKFADLVKESFNTIDALAKTSDKLGIAIEKLNGLQFAAKIAGVESNTFNMALQRMVRRVAEAAQGTGEAKNALMELGINARRLAQVAPDEQFLAVARAMSKVENHADRVRLAFKLFDSEGVALVNVLGQGEDGIRKLIAEAEKLNPALNRVNAAKIEAANDAITRMKAGLSLLVDSVAIELAPALENLAKQLSRVFDDPLLAAERYAATRLDNTIKSFRTLLPGGHLLPELNGGFRTLIDQDRTLGARGRNAPPGVDPLADVFAPPDPRDIFGRAGAKGALFGRLFTPGGGPKGKGALGGLLGPQFREPDVTAPGAHLSALLGGGKFQGVQFRNAFTRERESGRADPRIAGGALKGSREALERILRAQNRAKDPQIKNGEKQLAEQKKQTKHLGDLANFHKNGGLQLGIGLN